MNSKQKFSTRDDNGLHWTISADSDGNLNRDQIQILLLADIRRELNAMNQTFGVLTKLLEKVLKHGT